MRERRWEWLVRVSEGEKVGVVGEGRWEGLVRVIGEGE